MFLEVGKIVLLIVCSTMGGAAVGVIVMASMTVVGDRKR